ncbi:MAG: glycosyl transferase family 2 [Bacteroidetes bacterium]|nr:glycosyl transferase family 2 [Bacteroidota bacterium]
MSELSIVIPVYNNEHSLEALVEGITKALRGRLLYELILVNDGSSDGSWQEIEKIIAAYPTDADPLIAYDLSQNYGQENAKMAGLIHASGDYVVFMDADCQHDPVHIIALLEQCRNGADVCYANFSNSPANPFKRLGSSLYNHLAYKLLRKPKGIYLSSYTIMTKSMQKKVERYTSPLINIDALVLQHTQNVTQIFVEQRQSLNKKTNYTPLKLAALFFKLLPGFSIIPLRIILLFGLTFCSAAFILIIIKSAIHFSDPSAHFFIGSGKLMILGIGGIILTALGIIGEYIGKIYVMLSGNQAFEIQTEISSDDKK